MALSLRYVLSATDNFLYRSLLIALTLAYLLGQLLGSWQIFIPAVVLIFFVCVVLLLGILGGRRLGVMVCCLGGCFFLGHLTIKRVVEPELPNNHIRHLSLPQKVVLQGWLYREPQRTLTRERLYLEALQVWQDGKPRPASGRVLLTVKFPARSWAYGDIIQAPLRLRSPRNFHNPGGFDYKAYLARRGISVTAFLWDDDQVKRLGNQGGMIRAFVEGLRRSVGRFFDTQLDPTAAAILRALVIGDRGKISREMWQDFSRVGVTHVLAISGLHIGIVAFSAFALCKWLLSRSRYLLLTLTVPKVAALLAVVPVLFYAGLAGGNLATWRAVIMVLVYLGAVLLDRGREVYRSLALAALLISFFWPGSVGEISFQLSFLSILGIFLGLERFYSMWERWKSAIFCQRYPLCERILRWSLSYLAVSFFALLGTAPAVAAHFNRVSLVALFANTLVVPLLGSAAVTLGLLATLLFFVQQTVATLVIQLAGMAVSAGVWVVGVFAALPFAAARAVTPTLFELLLLYGLMGGWLLLPSRSRPLSLSLVSISIVLVLLLMGDVGYWVRQRFFRPELRVTFLDVGQGDAAVVEFPGSQVMVIDGGGFASEDFDSGEAIVARFLWSRKINRVDYLVMSHPQLDHFGGLKFLIESFAPRTLWHNGERGRGRRFQSLEVALDREEVQVEALCGAGTKKVIGGVKVEVLHPPCDHPGLETNDASLVLRLSYGGIDWLFSGDIEGGGERILLRKNPLASEILKVPHHGSRTSSTQAFVEAVSPVVAVVSVGSHNRYGFPAPEVVARYEEEGSAVVRTDEVGAITIISNGQGYTVKTFLPH